MPKPVKKKVDAEPTRPVVYPEITVNVCQGSDAITDEAAKQLMGWEEETESVKFDGEFLLRDENGNKVRCSNNAKNRPFGEGWCKTLAQDILSKNWKLNGETIIVGKTGLTLSGQHRLIGLILANQIWAGEQNAHWKKIWATPPVLETLVCFGVEETQEYTKTLDNVRPRTFSDVLYTSEVFGKLSPKEREQASKVMQYAIKLLWDRTGAKDDAYAPRRTHSEGLDFIERHGKLVKCVKHILEENTSGGVTAILPAGMAAGMMYLMSCSGSDPAKYHKSDNPSEKHLDFGLFDKAEEFWTLLAGASPDMKEVRHAIGAMADEKTGAEPATVSERQVIIIHAWNEYAHGGKLKQEGLMPKTERVDGVRVLTDTVNLGGIDLGSGSAVTKKENKGEASEPATVPGPAEEVGGVEGDDGEETVEEYVPSPEDVEAEKAKIKAENLKKKAEEGRPSDKFKQTVADSTKEVHERNGKATPPPRPAGQFDPATGKPTPAKDTAVLSRPVPTEGKPAPKKGGKPTLRGGTN